MGVAQPEKYKHVMGVIERRIRRGDYLLRPIPSERKIAEETGVSHMTARKAVMGLLARNVLVRRENGVLGVSPDYRAAAGPRPVALLCPAFASAHLTRLVQTVADAAEASGLRTRPLQYVHWDDPIVVRATGNRGGLIVIPSSLDVPAHVLAAMRSKRVVSLDLDLSDQGVPSIRPFPDDHVVAVFEHLRRLGHARVDCLSTHVHNPEIERRIGLWRAWQQARGVGGRLWERAAASFSDPTPAAVAQAHEMLAGGGVTAVVGTTFPAAVGAARACYERGLTVGRDVSVAAVNVESPARFMTPSVAGLDTPDLADVLRRCFDWFATHKPWAGPLRLEPAEPRLFVGESTGPAPGDR